MHTGFEGHTGVAGHTGLDSALAIGAGAVLLGAELAQSGARMYARAGQQEPGRSRSIRRLVLVQFDLAVLIVLILLWVARPPLPGPTWRIVTAAVAIVLATTFAHAVTMLVLVCRRLMHSAEPREPSGDTVPMLPSARSALRPKESPKDGVVSVLMVLTGLSGVVDATSYLGLGKLFLGKMTGNVETIGLTAAGVPGYFLDTALLALVSFLSGALAAGRLGRSLHPQRPRWLAIALAVEAVLLLAALLGAVATRADNPGSDNRWLVALLALAMGFRVATARKIGEPDMSTTLITLTLADLVADSTLAGGDHPRLLRRTGVVLAIMTGAGAGGYLFAHVGLIAPLSLAAAIATALAVIYPLFLLLQAAVHALRPPGGELQRLLNDQRDASETLHERLRRLEETVYQDREQKKK